jgi:hypothetical protein
MACRNGSPCKETPAIIDTINRQETAMQRNARIPDVTRHEDHVVTAREALEGLYLRLEQETEVRLVAAALRAGWSAREALEAIDELRKDDVDITRDHH